MYAKLTNGHLQRAPKQVHYKDQYIINPKEDVLLELGYLPIIYTDMPEDALDGYHYESHYEETETAILQVWEVMQDPVYPEPEPTMQDLIDAVERGLRE